MPPPSSSSSCSTNSSNLWQLSYNKLRFFTRIRRFLHSKTNPKGPKPSSPDPNGLVINIVSDSDHHHQQLVVVDVDSCSEVLMLQRAVKWLHFGCPKEKEMAATEIHRLANHNLKVKKLMAELGVIPPLVAMAAPPLLAEPEAAGRRLAAVTALLELATGNYTNKALMVEAGILEKLPKKIDESVDEATRNAFSELVLSLSSLNNSHVSLNPSISHLLPFTLAILDSHDSKPNTKDSCLGTLFNLSTALHNAANLASQTDTVESLLRVVVSSNQRNSNKPLCEKALATLGNIIVTLPGKKLVENSASVPHYLIEVLTWDDLPKAQELAAYVLMVLAHQSSAQRAKMAAAGIVPVLLQVALLGGSALAQKRAMKLLQWFKDERQMMTCVGSSHSGPQTRIGSPVMMEMQLGKNKRVMQRLVKDSLRKNMEMITKRAAVDSHGDSSSSSNLKSLVISTSSKSLPY